MGLYYIWFQFCFQKFCSVNPLNNYTKSFYENSTSILPEIQYDLQLISVQIMESRKNEILMALPRKRRALYNKSYRNRHVELKRSKDQRHYQVNREQTLGKRKIYYIESKKVINSNRKSICNIDSFSEENMYFQDCNTTK